MYDDAQSTNGKLEPAAAAVVSMACSVASEKQKTTLAFTKCFVDT